MDKQGYKATGPLSSPDTDAAREISNALRAWSDECADNLDTDDEELLLRAADLLGALSDSLDAHRPHHLLLIEERDAARAEHERLMAEIASYDIEQPPVPPEELEPLRAVLWDAREALGHMLPAVVAWDDPHYRLCQAVVLLHDACDILQGKLHAALAKVATNA